METGIAVLLIIVVIIFIAIIIQFNSLVRVRNKVKQSKSSIDVYLTQRFDLIPNLVETVKAYSKHEQEVFSKIAELRTSYSKTKDIKTAEELTNSMNTVMATAESNPNLQSSEQFLHLQKTLVKMESQLQAARRIYNGDVTLYNTAIETFPNNILAGILGFKRAELFAAEEYKKQNIKVEV